MNKNLIKLLRILARRRFSFSVDAITAAMYFMDEGHAEWDPVARDYKVESYRLTNRVRITDGDGRHVTVYTCDGLDALIDLDNTESQVMDADEVGVWALNYLRDEQVEYGKA